MNRKGTVPILIDVLQGHHLMFSSFSRSAPVHWSQTNTGIVGKQQSTYVFLKVRHWSQSVQVLVTGMVGHGRSGLVGSKISGNNRTIPPPPRLRVQVWTLHDLQAD